jgi:outer membrane murein-binding lipoprotein Lpp
VGSYTSVQNCTQRAVHAQTTDAKLDSIARAIYELAAYMGNLENQLNMIEHKLRTPAEAASGPRQRLSERGRSLRVEG